MAGGNVILVEQGSKFLMFQALLNRAHRWAHSDPSLTLIGTVIEALNIIISCIDVVSDVLVAHEFYSRGHTRWCLAVVASLIISNALYTLIFLDRNAPLLLRYFGRRVFDRNSTLATRTFTSNMRFTWTAQFVAFIVVFPVAQVVPFLSWALDDSTLIATATSFYIHRSSGTSRAKGVIETESQRWAKLSEGASAAEKELADLVNRDTLVLQRCNEAVQGHLKKHAVFYIETIVESLPQAIIQLMAISHVGETTSLQSVSLALSIFSIVSKAYVASITYHISLFLFTFAVVVHDIFNLFFIASTIVSHTEPPEIPLTSTWSVSRLSAWWFAKEAALVGLAGGLLLVFAASVAIKHLWRHRFRISVKWVDIAAGAAIFLCAVGFLMPLLVVVEGVKLSLLLFIISAVPSQKTSLPVFAVATSFILGGKDAAERHTRFHHLVFQAVHQPRVSPSSAASLRHRGRALPAFHWVSMSERCCFVRKEALKQCPFNSHNIIKIAIRHQCEPLVKFVVEWRSEIRRVVAFVWHRLRHDIRNNPSNLLTFAYFCVAALLPALLLCSALFGLGFPFIHWLQHWGTHSSLQTFCFVGVIVSLLVLLALSGTVMKVLLIGIELHVLFPVVSNESLPCLQRTIIQYFMPESHQVLVRLVPPDLLPIDVTGVVASFLAPSDLNLRSYRLDELRALQKSAHDS